MSDCPCGGIVTYHPAQLPRRPRVESEYCWGCEFTWGVKYDR